MATFGKTPMDPRKLMAPVNPRVGFPVINQGGMPQTPTTAPPKPFVTSPTVGAQPGPAGAPMELGKALAPLTGKGGGLPGGLMTPPPNPSAPAAEGMRPGGSLTPIQAPMVLGPSGTNPIQAPPASPAPGVPAAPTTAPTTPTPAPTSTSTSSSSGASGQTGVISPSAQGNLESQLQDYIKQGLSGETVSKDFINRAKGAVSRNVWGQQRAGEQAINDDAVRRGLFRSGIPAESIAGLRGKSQGAIASGVADILNSAEAQNIQGKQAAAGTGSDLLSANRSWEQYQTNLAEQRAARAAANQPDTWDYIDPESGERVTVDNSWFF